MHHLSSFSQIFVKQVLCIICSECNSKLRVKIYPAHCQGTVTSNLRLIPRLYFATIETTYTAPYENGRDIKLSIRRAVAVSTIARFSCVVNYALGVGLYKILIGQCIISIYSDLVRISANCFIHLKNSAIGDCCLDF